MRKYIVLLWVLVISLTLVGCKDPSATNLGSETVPSDSECSDTTEQTQMTSYQGITDDGMLAYEVSDGVVKITDVLADDSCIQIPDAIDAYPVTIIGDGAFYQKNNCNSVILPKTLCVIESGAFYRCHAITDIWIPASVTYIAADAFFRTENLQHIYVEDENRYYCDVDGILFSADMSEFITYPEGKVGDEFVIPDCVTTIKGCAFGYYPAVKKVIIPASVTAFPDVPLAAIFEAITIVAECDSEAAAYASHWGIPLETSCI